MWLHYHPDAIIYFRDSNDAIVAQWTFDEFKKDYGQPFPPLPLGAAQLELWEPKPGEWVISVYDAKHNEMDAFEVDITPYKTVLDALPRLLEKRQERLTATQEWAKGGVLAGPGAPRLEVKRYDR